MIKKNIYIFILFLLIIFIYLYKIGDIPNGFFADEAEIGYKAYQLTHGDSSFLITPFFYHHFNYVLGALPVYATSPFIAIFGLSEFSVRLSSVIYSTLTLIIIYLIFKKLKISYIWQSILLFSFTPIYFHISRINFGHMPSIFLLFLGFLLFLNLIEKPSLILIFASALIIALSSYGYGAFMITSPVFITLVSIWYIFVYRQNGTKIKVILLFLVIFAFGFLPIPISYFTNIDLRTRINEKKNNQPVSVRKTISSIIKNYPKYYSIDYLFTKGEVDMPGGFVKRHSVQGNGILLSVTALFFIGVFLYCLKTNKILNIPLPLFIFIFLLYPISDILFTDISKPPYTFAVFSFLSLCLPFLIGYGFEGLNIKKNKILIQIVNFVILIQVILFLNNYNNYPLYSSNYWGWQSGPKEIIAYFKTQTNNYDELYMTGYFNAPEIFLKFYDPEHKCNNCFIGGSDRLNLEKKQLFAVRVEEINTFEKIHFKIVKIVYYPDGKKAFYIIKASS